jgi:hypothetical protein
MSTEYFNNHGKAFIMRIANIKDDDEFCKELEIDMETFKRDDAKLYCKNIVKYCNERIINLNYVFG